MLHWWKCEEDASRGQGAGEERVTLLGMQKIPANSMLVFPFLKGQIHSTALKFAVVLGPQVLRQLPSLEAAEEHCLLSKRNILRVSFQLKERVMADKKSHSNPSQGMSVHSPLQPAMSSSSRQEAQQHLALAKISQSLFLAKL